MIRWLWIATAMTLVGCVNTGYRYAEDGYWTSPRSQSTVVVSMGWANCSGWGAAFGAPFHVYGYGYPHGYGYGHGYPYGYGWAPCGFGYGGWYGAGLGYWRDPYWSYPWYLPSGNSRLLPAGERARQMARYPAEGLGASSRYEDLTPARRRDTGGGDRSWRTGGGSYAPILVPSPQSGIGAGTRGPQSGGYPATSQGLGGGRFNNSPGLSGASRPAPDQRSMSSPRSVGFPAPAPRSAASEARALPRERRDEE
jgi:hypothetical protein